MRFNRINPNRSIPTSQRVPRQAGRRKVSIVSIQTDQSRHLTDATEEKWNPEVSIVSIQTDQSRLVTGNFGGIRDVVKFQSYQSKQINPDDKRADAQLNKDVNVSIVSIQTDQSRRVPLDQSKAQQEAFQSYQSKQINPDPDLGQKFYPVE